MSISDKMMAQATEGSPRTDRIDDEEFNNLLGFWMFWELCDGTTETGLRRKLLGMFNNHLEDMTDPPTGRRDIT